MTRKPSLTTHREMIDSKPRKLISIISPCFNEADNVEHCYRAVRECFEQDLPGYDYEHIFCDNASTDGTVDALERLAADDARLKIIVNSRNFGPLRSTYNAVLAASGDAVLTMLPVDLQDPPAVLPEMVKQWENGHEVVYGIRAQREEGWLMQRVRRAYYRAVRRFSNIDIPINVGSFQLVDRAVIKALRQFGDHYPHLPGMIASCGFRRIGVPYTWKARARGIAKNRIWHLADEALNALISFSCLPMRLSMMAGCTIAVLSLAYAALNLILNLCYFRQLAAPGIPSLVIAVFFFAGIQLFFLGVLGEYISAIHFQVRRRPLVIERKRVNFDNATPNGSELQMLQEIYDSLRDASGLTTAAPPSESGKSRAQGGTLKAQ